MEDELLAVDLYRRPVGVHSRDPAAREASDAAGLGDHRPLEPDSSGGSRELVSYRFGFFDTDALSACVSGALYIPVSKPVA